MINLSPECIGRTVIYRDSHGDGAEEGVITSYNNAGIAFVRYGSDKFSQATRVQSLEWLMSDDTRVPAGTPATQLTPEQGNRLLHLEQQVKRSTEELQLRQWCIMQAIEAHKGNPVGDIPSLAAAFYIIATAGDVVSGLGLGWAFKEKSGAD